MADVLPVAGYNGTCTINALTTMAITEWSAQGACTPINTTHGLCEGAGAYTPGIIRWNVSVTCHMNDGDHQVSTIEPGDTVTTLELFLGASKVISFANVVPNYDTLGIINSIVVSEDVEGVMSVTFGIAVSGEPTMIL